MSEGNAGPATNGPIEVTYFIRSNDTSEVSTWPHQLQQGTLGFFKNHKFGQFTNTPNSRSVLTLNLCQANYVMARDFRDWLSKHYREKGVVPPDDEANKHMIMLLDEWFCGGICITPASADLSQLTNPDINRKITSHVKGAANATCIWGQIVDYNPDSGKLDSYPMSKGEVCQVAACRNLYPTVREDEIVYQLDFMFKRLEIEGALNKVFYDHLIQLVPLAVPRFQMKVNVRRHLSIVKNYIVGRITDKLEVPDSMTNMDHRSYKKSRQSVELSLFA